MADKLDPGTVPSGSKAPPFIKRLSSIPGLIIAGISGVVIAAVAWTFWEKMNPGSQPGAAKQEAPKSSSAMPEQISGPFSSEVIIEPKPAAPPMNTPVTTPPKDVPKQDVPPSPELQQLQAQRLRELGEALRSKTAIRFETALPAAADKTGAKAEYDRQVNQVSATLPSGEGEKDEIGKFSRGNRWALDNRLETPDTPFMLRAGAVIPATMISGISSDLPGQVIAQVSQNVYDTATGVNLLIPQGTRLVGSYASNVAYGQSRVLMAWQRLVFPDGRALDIGAMPGADQSGYAGFTDKTNNHYLRIFGSALLLSGVVAAVDISQDSSSSGSSDKQRASDAMSEALGQTLGQAIAQMLQKNLNISPTLEIRPGYRFNVMATRDIRLPASYRPFETME